MYIKTSAAQPLHGQNDEAVISIAMSRQCSIIGYFIAF